MFAKKCPRCDQWSFSAADMGDWFCPFCRNNLKDAPAVSAGRVDVESEIRRLRELEKKREEKGQSSGGQIK
uniref:Uncharacterized protein n=1 Tax=Ammonifex degensii TaxID=42838 RepID=A0A7C1F3F5_9THEO